ncbi:hypothetical protein LguiA_021101 [Lonicera macranthoides]
MPLSLDEYQIAQMYMVTKMQQENTTSTEGVDVVENRPFEDDVLGRGHYTSKIYRLQSKAPGWLTTFAPSDALILLEEAWNAYPRCKTADNGRSENVHCLTKEKLAARQVDNIDIASSPTDYWSYIVGSSSVDLSKFQSSRSGRGPLLEGWQVDENFQDTCNPVMTAYKLVTVDAPYWGFGSRVEQAFIAGERALFLESHRNCFAWIDEWIGMTLEVISELEQRTVSSLNEILQYQQQISSFTADVHLIISFTLII